MTPTELVDVGPEERLERAFTDAGVTAGFHAVALSGGADIAYHADQLEVMASVFKLPVLIALLRAADAGEVDLGEQMAIPVQGRAPGSTGLSVMTDAVTMSLRDLARWMIVVSDNAASDLVLQRIGMPAVNSAMTELGCRSTRVTQDVRDIFDTIVADASLSSIAEFNAAPTVAQLSRMRALRPLETNYGTARDLTRLLSLLWTNQAASPKACALGRQILRQQVWPHRMASGFPEDDVATAGKTGTLATVRNEVGVVTYPDGESYAIAVFTTAAVSAAKHPAADAVIGTAARIAVDELRDTT